MQLSIKKGFLLNAKRIAAFGVVALVVWAVYSALPNRHVVADKIYFVSPLSNLSVASDESIADELFPRDSEYGVIQNHIYRTSVDGLISSHEQLVADLKARLPDQAGELGRDMSDYLFRLENPSSDTKKILRAVVEVELKGRKRTAALRHIIPVLTVRKEIDRGPCDQLVDDVIYAHDNFGGIGFILDEQGLAILRECKTNIGKEMIRP